MGTDVRLNDRRDCLYSRQNSLYITGNIFPFGSGAPLLRSFMLKDRHDGGGVVYPVFNSQFFFPFLINNENVYCSALSR